MIPSTIRIQHGQLPDRPGVYLLKDKSGAVLYIGKATSLARRVRQHFERPHNDLIQEMTPLVRQIDYIEKPTALEAMILEANLIKEYWPPYNTDQKDGKSFLYVAITNDPFPKPLLIRGADLEDDAARRYQAVFGPYTSARSLRAALDMVRKVIPWSTCDPGKKRPCFYVHLGQCPGVCTGAISRKEYARIIRDLIRFFQGKKDSLIQEYQKKMNVASRAHRFEEAASYRDKVYFLEHIKDIAFMKREVDDEADGASGKNPEQRVFGRIEGYDISHISGTSSVASMVVFENGAPAKGEYRKFRIRTVEGSNDVASLQEAILRRFRHREWRKPDLLLIDGGLPQVHAVEEVLNHLHLSIPLLGMAKGPKRDRADLIPGFHDLELLTVGRAHLRVLTQVRDEAHRFAITYHRAVRSKAIRPTRKHPEVGT